MAEVPRLSPAEIEQESIKVVDRARRLSAVVAASAESKNELVKEALDRLSDTLSAAGYGSASQKVVAPRFESEGQGRKRTEAGRHTRRR
jgi:hypothetical protein